MKVLIVNDDGIKSPGLKTLVEHLLPYGYELMVLAPTTEKSASSHALTVRKGMKLTKYPDIFEGVPTYSLEGSPADCVKFAKHQLSFPFDIVVSGINNGLNMGHDILYSGTVAGASEGALLGAKGISFSCEIGDLSGFIKCFDKLWPKIINSQLFQEGNVLNINIPKHFKGIKITRQGYNPFRTQFVLEGEYYYARGSANHYLDVNEIETDIKSFHQGYISITPLTVDRTDLEVFNKYQDLKW
ncbi:MAG: 5'/3'-nucleotidase SurE [Bacilli bacterium]|jgi:5'-nucleotidase|nr:5'/3'-nucleotidase SurE [Bacilli bacterium]HHU23751.1 5'/3'-nucleotidase SurE [Acholeplasmataceae bacterium]